MKHPLKERPWLYIVFAFLLLMTAWTGLIVVAVKNKPASIPLEEDSSRIHPRP